MMSLQTFLKNLLIKDQQIQTFLSTQNQLLRQENRGVVRENTTKVVQNILSNYPTFQNHPELLNLLADALLRS